jgi:glycerate kinase
MALALGWKFLKENGDVISDWTGLGNLDRMIPPEKSRTIRNVVVAVDVQNPLLGPEGCSRIYGPQKGLRSQDFPAADEALSQLARVARKQFGRDFAVIPGAGAAGGLGFGLMAFLKAKPKPGFDLFADYAGLQKRLKEADIVITGEGSMDKSTLMGKGVGEVGRVCGKLKIPCIGLAGRAADKEKLQHRFVQVHGLTPDLVSPKEAMANPQKHLRTLSAQVAKDYVE